MVASGSSSINAPVALGDNLSVAAATGTSLTIPGPISESGGSHALTVAGGGTLTLSGVNSFTGGTVVAGGTVRVTTPTALANGSSLTVGATALQFFASAPVIAASRIESIASTVTAMETNDCSTDADVQPVASFMAAAMALPHALPARSAAAMAFESYARKVALPVSWANVFGFDGPQDKRHPAVQALDAVLAEYGRER